MVMLLDQSSVSYSQVKLQSVYVASLLLNFEVTLETPPNNQTSALLTFLDLFTSSLSSFGGYNVREGNRGSAGITPACELDYGVHSMHD